MALASGKKHNRRQVSAKKVQDPSAGRMHEALGLVAMTLSLLVCLALVTYRGADDAIVGGITFRDIFVPGENQASNILGWAGAWVAYWIVPRFLGYPFVLLTGFLCMAGYLLFRRRTSIQLVSMGLLVFAIVFAAASFFGWISLVFDVELALWSGALGLGVAGWLQHVFGTVGSAAILALLIAIAFLLLAEPDVQALFDKVSGWNASRKDAAAQRRAARKQRTDEKRKTRQAKRAEQKKRRAEKTSGKAAEAGSEEASEEASPASRPSSGPTTPAPASSGEPSRTRNDAFRPADPAPDAEDAPEKDIEIHVQERIQEEHASKVQRSMDIPDEKFAHKYRFPPVKLLDKRDADEIPIDYDELEENKRILLDKLDTYGIEIREINAIVGPTVTLYELTPAPGVKINKITALENDLAMAMAARGIRIIAPIPGKSAVGVEIPNRRRELVRIRDVIGTARFRDSDMALPVPVGKTIEGEVFMIDLAKLPHLLIAGATGSGKSVGLNTLITGLMYACHPASLKFVMIDPKKIELQQYKYIADHYAAMPENSEEPIITDVSQALGALKSCEREMELRYDLFSEAQARSIKDYNNKVRAGQPETADSLRHLPYIVVIIDELADLMMLAGKEIEAPIARLAQMARAVGIHLVLATQRPSVDVITGLIKANFPARIAYQVASKVDSRTILDQNGAEGLVGNGDLLYMLGSRAVRLQGPYIASDEVDRVVDFVAKQQGAGPYALPPFGDDAGPGATSGMDDMDPFFEEAAHILVRARQGSVSLLQRKLSIGYTRAARIVDQLEQAGVVGRFVGSKARDVLVESEEELERLLADVKTSA